MPVPNPVTVGPVTIGRGQPLALICGPCVMEPGDMTRIIAIAWSRSAPTWASR